MTKQALLFVNRQSRKGQKHFAQAVEALHDLDFELITVPARRSQELSEMIRQNRDRLDVVIVGGGDGTLNAVVDCLVDMQLPLGILPLGTANDLARTLGIPQSIPQACKAIATGSLKAIDLGWVNGKHFFNVASMGLSVEITRKLSKGAKRRWGALAYGATAMQVVWQTRGFQANIAVNGALLPVQTVQIAIGNGRYYGGGMSVASDATIDDQRLDLYSLELQHWWQVFPLLWTMPQGKHVDLPWVRSLQAQEFEIHTRKPLPINTDGEITTQTPATFRVIPRALQVFIPEGLTVG